MLCCHPWISLSAGVLNLVKYCNTLVCCGRQALPVVQPSLSRVGVCKARTKPPAGWVVKPLHDTPASYRLRPLSPVPAISQQHAKRTGRKSQCVDRRWERRFTLHCRCFAQKHQPSHQWPTMSAKRSQRTRRDEVLPACLPPRNDLIGGSAGHSAPSASSSGLTPSLHTPFSRTHRQQQQRWLSPPGPPLPAGLLPAPP
jgi:hypothetical protein